MSAPIIATRPPTACAGCYGQYPDRLHVDFRSAIEGGPIPSEHAKALRVDWVVLCETCIQAAVAILPENVAAKAAYEAQIAQLRERCEAAENYASTVEDALSRRPDSLPPREPRESREPKVQRPRRPNSRDLAGQVERAMAEPITAPVAVPAKDEKPARAVPKSQAAGKRVASSRYARKA